MSEARLTIISPVLNEARHIEAVVAGMQSQTRPPDEWIVVDDGSSDGTLDLLGARRRTFRLCESCEAPAAPLAAGVDRLHHAAEARAFNYGLSQSLGLHPRGEVGRRHRAPA